MKIVPEISLRHDLQYFLFISTPTIDIEPIINRPFQNVNKTLKNPPLRRVGDEKAIDYS